jgi:hypothetical protein
VSVPIGFALVIALLMIPLLILAWTTRGYACTILLVSAVSCLCFWGFRIGDFFRAFKFFNDVEFLQDFVAPALYAGVFLVPSLLVVKLSRFLNARKMLRLAQSSD